MHRPHTLPAVLLVLGAACAPAAAGELQTLAGKKTAGELVAADDKVVLFKSAAGEAAVPLADVLAVDTGSPFATVPPNTPWAEVELIDGSLFRCKSFSITGKTAEMTLLNGRAVQVPLVTLASVLNSAHDAKVKADWATATAKKSRADRLVVIPPGGGLDVLEGSFGEGSANGQRIAFTVTGGGKTNPKLDAVAGLLFQQRQEGTVPATLCRVTDAGRNVLVAKAHSAGAKGAKITTVCGAEIEYPSAAELVKLDYSKGKMDYLSDLKATVESTDKDSTVTVFRDEGPDKGSKLRLKGKELRGLNVPVQPGRTSLVFDIGGDYKEFKALVGVDDSIEFDSEAKLTIEVDGKEVYAAEVRRRDDPKPVNLDVRNGKQLRISVTTDRIDLAQWVTLGDAKVSK